MKPQRPEGPPLDAELALLLADHPLAPAAAINPDGMITVAPASLAILATHPGVDARSVIDLVTPESRLEVVNAWRRVRAGDPARFTALLLDGPDDPVTVHFFNTTAEHGVMVAVFIGEGVESPLRAGLRRPPPPPRLATVLKDDLSVITDVDDAVTAMLGWRREDMLGQRSLDFVHPDDQERAIGCWMEMLAYPRTAHRVKLRHACRDGSWRWVEIVNENRLDDDDLHDVRAQLVDISDEMAAEEALREREQLLDRLAEALPLGVLQIDTAGNVVYTNERLHEIVGVPPAPRIDEQLRGVLDEDRAALSAVVFSVLTVGDDHDLEIHLDVPGRSGVRLCRLTMRALTADDGTVSGAVACVADVTDGAQMRMELEHRATYDVLTKCHNRGSVLALLDKTIEREQDSAGGTAVAFIDLDRFKAVNDRYGHGSGDEVLQAVAERLRGAVRGNDIVGRLGGDEFLVVLPEVHGAAGAMSIATRIADLLRRDIDLPDGPVQVRASIGVAWTDHAHTDADHLVAEADAAMYESKRRAAGQPVLYASTLHRAPQRGIDDERWVRAALDDGRLEVHYQPIVDIVSGETVGYEALLRGHRDDRVLPAADFIELAEQVGAVHDIGRWVTEVVCAQAARCNADRPHLSWSMNVSPLEIATGGVAESLADALRRHGLTGAQFVVETTAHEMLVDGLAAKAALQHLDRLGATLALDHFGRGWSSLELLRALPFRAVKVDPRLTSTVVDHARTGRIVETLLMVGRSLDLDVVVTGIETDEQRAVLAGLGARRGQGFLFGAPRPAADLFGDGSLRLTS
jgi:diguanylate cyclase (GGDEF)-like protein/PAS domain S-box-containing protein